MAKIDKIEIEIKIPEVGELEAIAFQEWFWRNKITPKERKRLLDILLRVKNG